MNGRWYDSVNPKLDRLTRMLSGSKPSHGYTIAEEAPEIVTAPGVYFPAERGRVIPMASRNEGGDVIPMRQNDKGVYESPPLHKDNERAKLEMVHSIISKVNPGGLEHNAMKGLMTPPEPMKIEQSKYDILKSALSVLKPQKVGTGSGEKEKPVRVESRQGGGSVSPPVGMTQEEWDRKTYGLEGGIGSKLATPMPTPSIPGLYDRLKSAFGSWNMTPTPTESTATTVRQKQGPGFWQADIGETSPESTYTGLPPETEPASTNPIDRVREYLRQLTTMFSRARGGNVEPPEDEIDRLLANMQKTPEEIELASRRKWAAPSAPERILATARETSPGTVAVIPGYQKSYYEVHPEELVADEIAATNKSTIDAVTKAIQDTKNRAEGFGLIGLSPKDAALAQREAATQLPILISNLEKMKATEGATRERLFRDVNIPTKSISPHLVQTESGPAWAMPGVPGVLPLGVRGPAKSLTNEQLIADDLRNRLKREPTGAEILDEADRRKINLQLGGIKPLPAGTMGSPTGVRNDAALEGLTEEQKGIVRGMADYKYPWPGSFALRDPKWQALMGRIEMYDPSFSAPEYQVRYRLRQDFTSGKSATNIRSLNTAVAHLETLSKKAESLDNAPVQLWNAIKNKGLTAVGDKRVTEFNNAATAVESELANVFKGMGATDQEIKAWRANLSTSQSPEQLKGAINTAIELLGGRLGALQSQYETGMGVAKDFRFLSDKSRKILTKLGIDVETIDPSIQKASPAAGGGNAIKAWKLINGKWVQE